MKIPIWVVLVIGVLLASAVTNLAMVWIAVNNPPELIKRVEAWK